MRALVLSIDMDSVGEYAALHGLAQLRPSKNLYTASLQRFVELCQLAGGAGTIFAIGRDVTGEAAVSLRRLVQAGFEVANHSFSHDYHLSRRARRYILTELELTHARIADATGVQPVGMRAPGYHLSAALLDAAMQLGYLYDSSVLASMPYYLAKLAALGLYRLRGRRSAALLGWPTSTLAPPLPYRPAHDPYKPGKRDLWELPITTGGLLQLPFTGAAFLLAPPWALSRLLATAERLPTVVLNLHAIELADGHEVPKEIYERQPELHMPPAARLARLRQVVSHLARTRTTTTCAALASALTETTPQTRFSATRAADSAPVGHCKSP